ncbi:hypothetical protein [Kitasatospora purpeofusca]|uniref:hypothetical protein n=1 Tax=Kitasatospora purpeofusca TaxID=67352 RepID=UPI003F4AD445
MATKALAHGMGTFFKQCEHPQARWFTCPHEYTIRYRDAAGRRAEESGFTTQDKAITRLSEIYKAKKDSPRNQSKADRIQKYEVMQFGEYVAEWKAGQRHLGEASVRHLDSLLEHHLFPAFRSRRMGTFDHKVVDGFLQTMERNGAGLATQANAYDKLKSILLDAHRLGIYDDNPLEGVKPPAVRPSARGHSLAAATAGHSHRRRRHVPLVCRPHERLWAAQWRGGGGQPQEHPGR